MGAGVAAGRMMTLPFPDKWAPKDPFTQLTLRREQEARQEADRIRWRDAGSAVAWADEEAKAWASPAEGEEPDYTEAIQLEKKLQRILAMKRAARLSGKPDYTEARRLEAGLQREAARARASS